MIKWLLNLFKRKNNTYDNININQNKTEPSARIINIEVTTKDNYTIIDIPEDCNITEYVDALNRIGQESLELTNGTLFDNSWNVIRKKKIYIVNCNNIEYIIYSNDIKIRITEKIKYPEEDGYIDERVIEIDKNGEYTISNLKHSKSLSTFYVKSYSSKNPNQEFFKLEKDKALQIAKEILSNLTKIPFIKEIIDLQPIYQSINNEKNYSYKFNNQPHQEESESNQDIKRILSKN